MQRRDFMKLSAAALAAPYIVTGVSGAARAAGGGKRVRRDVMKMDASDPFFRQYAQAVAAMHNLRKDDTRTWRNQALIHLHHCPHHKEDFVHWHRWYLNYFEQICGELIGEPDFALPYWNWSENGGRIPDPFYDLEPLNVVFWNDKSDAQSDNWGPDEVVTVGVRGLTKGVGLQDREAPGQDFFSYEKIRTILESPTFEIFTNQLERQPHDKGHVIVGAMPQGQPQGHMGDGMSPLDPIFWLHHCNIDRLWAQWEAASPEHRTVISRNYDYSNNFVDAKGNPVPVADANSAVDLKNFDYIYDTMQASAVELAGVLEGAPRGEQLLLAASAVSAVPQVLGSVAVKDRASLTEAATATVAAGNLTDAMFSSRVFWAASPLAVTSPRLAVANRRIYATLGITDAPGTSPMLVNVYVNRPKDTTVTGGPYFTGSFAFFASAKGHHAADQKVIIDITGALHEQAQAGLLTSSDVTIDLVPVPAVEGARTDDSFVLSKVDLEAI
ncbi:tyrosinase family protein [Caenispirillum bisanense]|uniref:tyrosinase family protein n=1 Tax=Caenispirillum bisanense TaxID=414052 RepID=UPI0031D5F50C